MKLTLIIWLAVLIATLIGLWTLGEEQFSWLTSLGVLVQATATFQALATGWQPARLVRTTVLVVVCAWATEWLGTTSGFPFGDYSYTNILQPQLAGVPLLIPLAWFMMLPPAWATAEAGLALFRNHLGRSYPFAYAALSALAFTAWDLYLDPQMVAHGLWTWQHPSGYFGIPWTNFLGWLGVATLLTLLLRPERLPWISLVTIYSVTWLFQAIGLGIFWGQPGPALVGFIGMGAFALLAWYSIRKQTVLS